MKPEQILDLAANVCGTCDCIGHERYHFSEDEILKFAELVIRPYVQENFSVSMRNAALEHELREMRVMK